MIVENLVHFEPLSTIKPKNNITKKQYQKTKTKKTISLVFDCNISTKLQYFKRVLVSWNGNLKSDRYII